MIAAFADHVWQSTAFAALIGLLAIALRSNRAAVRYGLWFAASLKFLIPCSLFAALAGLFASAWPFESLGAVTPAVLGVARPVSTRLAPVATTAAFEGWVALLAGVWLAGFATIAALRVRSWRAVRAAMRGARPVSPIHSSAVEVRVSPGLLEPGVVGLWRPIVLIPDGLETHLTARQLDAVLAHEACHIRRRDNLMATSHMVIEAIFWFHPVVWWVGARLLAERERACDEHVAQMVDQPRTYAEALVAVCRFYVESPLACVSGVGGSSLTSRVEYILRGQVGVPMTMPKKMSLAVALLLALLTSVVSGATPMRTSDQGRSAGSGRVTTVRTPQETALIAALFVMRDAIDQFRHDKDRYPRTLAMLVQEGYLKTVPVDPFTNSATTWRIVRDPKNPKTTGVYDVKSAATGLASDGSKYADW
jgi:bla regulator protein blaR1